MSWLLNLNYSEKTFAVGAFFGCCALLLPMIRGDHLNSTGPARTPTQKKRTGKLKNWQGEWPEAWGMVPLVLLPCPQERFPKQDTVS